MQLQYNYILKYLPYRMFSFNKSIIRRWK